MNCPKCTHLLRAGARFCDYCGAPVGAADTEAVGGGASDGTEAARPHDPLIGRTLDTKYELLGRLGEGGMGVVYRGRRVHIGDEVAVKVLLQKYVADAASVERFRREAQAAAMLRHVNIVAIYDYGEGKGEDAPAYIVMELLEGESLRDLLNVEGRLKTERAVALMCDICLGVGSAHRRGVLHRDLKPDNVIILPPDEDRDRESVKVVDFGIAKLRDLAGAPSLTQTGAVVGTPYYMSPEQCRGESLDARSDVYSLGAMTYEMLAGSPPFTARTVTGVIAKHLFEDPPPLPESLRVPAAIEQVIRRALAKDPEARQPTASALARELQDAERRAREEEEEELRRAEEEERRAEEERQAAEEHERAEAEAARRADEEAAGLREEQERQEREVAEKRRQLEAIAAAAAAAKAAEEQRERRRIANAVAAARAAEEEAARLRAEPAQRAAEEPRRTEADVTSFAATQTLSAGATVQMEQAESDAEEPALKRSAAFMPPQSPTPPPPLMSPVATSPRHEEPKRAQMVAPPAGSHRRLMPVAAFALLVAAVGGALLAVMWFRSTRGTLTASTAAIPTAMATPETKPPLKNRVGIELVWIPPGVFDMGSEEGEKDERPVHRVNLGGGFYMGKYEVTRAQWRELMKEGPPNSEGDADERPVLAYWDQAQSFIDKLNAEDGEYSYRLPSEAEWEYACRAGGEDVYRAGKMKEYVSYLTGKAVYLDNFGEPQKVGLREPNAFGLQDMLGNVWEWCQDYYHADYNGAPQDGRPWVEDANRNLRAARGGSWGSFAYDCRCTNRAGWTPTRPGPAKFAGFRIVATQK